MRFSRLCALTAMTAAVLEYVTGPADARPTGVPTSVFACSLGRKSVSVTAVGDQLIYRFGTPSQTEISIIGRVDRKNVLYRADRYSSMEYQLRFLSGPYSYIVYSMGGNASTGTSSVSGLLVMKGNTRISDMSCTHFANLRNDLLPSSLPEDTEQYSAM